MIKSRACRAEAHSSAHPRLAPKAMAASACLGGAKVGLPGQGLKERRSNINYSSVITRSNFRMFRVRKRKASLGGSVGVFTQYFYSSIRIGKI